jgi:hypothetical protein
VFFGSQERISLIGKVDRAPPIDNQRRRCAAIAGFGTCCSGAGSNCVATPPNRELSEPFKRLETLVYIIIYLVQDSEWVSPVQVVPKKGCMTLVQNERNELIPLRTVTGWRMCINYRMINKATQNDHIPLPFIDEMLERLAKHSFFCYLDGYSYPSG